MDTRDYLAALRRDIEAGAVRAELDFGKLDHIDSPLVVEAEKTRWLYVFLVACLAIGWFVAWQAGVAAAATCALLYATVVRRLLRTKMRRRFTETVLFDLDKFRKLWRLSGIVLVDDRTGARVESPGGNWIRFMMDRQAHADDGARAAS